MIGAWDGIEEFVHIARAGSFTSGAKSFGASVTHMSRSLSRLEARLQTQLFFRTTRKLRLTDTGKLFFEACDRIVGDREEAMAAVSSSGEPIGELRLTSSHTLGEKFIAPMACEFAEQHPSLSLTMKLDNAVTDLVTEGYDLAVRIGPLTDSRLIATRVASRSVVTVAAPSYIAKYGTPQSVAELSQHQCIGKWSGAYHFAGGEEFKPKGRWRSNNGNAAVMATVAGMGICQLPSSYAHEHLQDGTLVTVLQEFAPEDEPIWAVYPQRKHLSPKVALFVEQLRQRLQPMLDAGKFLPNK